MTLPVWQNYTTLIARRYVRPITRRYEVHNGVNGDENLRVCVNAYAEGLLQATQVEAQNGEVFLPRGVGQ